jgi:hypothetical protein
MPGQNGGHIRNCIVRVSITFRVRHSFPVDKNFNIWPMWVADKTTSSKFPITTSNINKLNLCSKHQICFYHLTSGQHNDHDFLFSLVTICQEILPRHCDSFHEHIFRSDDPGTCAQNSVNNFEGNLPRAQICHF